MLSLNRLDFVLIRPPGLTKCSSVSCNREHRLVGKSSQAVQGFVGGDPSYLGLSASYVPDGLKV